MGVILQKTEAQRGKGPRPRSCRGFAGKLSKTPYSRLCSEPSCSQMG